MLRNKKVVYDAIVIGGGPAGIMATGTAAGRGKKVLIIEKNKILGKKLLISGKGRCNLTNAEEDVNNFLKQFSPSGIFLKNALHKFFNRELMDFFEQRGLRLKVERGKRVFPQSNKSENVLKVLLDFLRKSGAQVLYNCEVSSLKKTDDLFYVILKNRKLYCSLKVVLATGGSSYPETGSDGYGFSLAKNFGHNIVEIKPGLVGINLKGNLFRKWQGISLKNVTCILKVNNQVVTKEFGEMLFTHFGVSGPIILDLSSRIFDTAKQARVIRIYIDFKPALTPDKLDARLIREFKEQPNKNLDNIFERLLPRRLVDDFIKTASVDPKKKANQITKFERLNLRDALKSFEFEVSGVRPVNEAIVTRGGVDTKEINPQTMESRLVGGLYFAGEIIDVDARTGGYNMQAAFSTGYIAGENQ